jgi:hypothetical protein
MTCVFSKRSLHTGRTWFSLLRGDGCGTWMVRGDGEAEMLMGAPVVDGGVSTMEASSCRFRRWRLLDVGLHVG